MGKSAPKPDPNIGKAAMASAEMGEKYLSWMQDQSAITNAWALEDRDRHQSVFQPLEDQMVRDAQNYSSPERKALAASEAIGDVRQQFEIGRGKNERRLTSLGVSPGSGRFNGEARRGETAESLAAAGAGNMARRNVDQIGDQKLAGVVNMGRGLAVNPATSMGMAHRAGAEGFSGAMQGYGQQGSLLLSQHDAQMKAYNANQNMLGGIGQGFGMILGASSKDYKTNKKKPMSVLDAVKDMPVEEWEYKKGIADGGAGRHVGPYAEDFKRATGLGDGRTINIMDAVGVNMGATQDLAKQVERIERKLDGKKKPAKKKEAA